MIQLRPVEFKTIFEAASERRNCFYTTVSFLIVAIVMSSAFLIFLPELGKGGLFLVPGMFFVAGLVMAGYIVYVTRKEIILYRNGKVVNAEVLSATRRKPSLLYKLGENSRLCYRYKDSRGQMHVTEKFTKEILIPDTLKSGDTIRIFVSPDDESKSALIPVAIRA